jgi:alkaline phosphatase
MNSYQEFFPLFAAYPISINWPQTGSRENFMKSNKARLMRGFAIACLIAAVVVCTQPLQYAEANNANNKIKNVILLIPDGISYESMKVVDYFMNGMAESQVFNQFPVQVSVATPEFEYIYEYTYDADGIVTGYEVAGYIYFGYDPQEMWSDFNYAIWYDPLISTGDQDAYINRSTDSASAATAMATGFKAKDGAISYGFKTEATVASIDDFARLTNISDIAKKLGKASGVVSSVPFSHATPSAFVAHNPNRNDYFGIADEMIFDSGIEVIMGPGFMDYEYSGAPRVPPRPANRMSQDTINIVTEWYNDGPEEGGFTVVRTREDFQTLGSAVNPPLRVLGVPKVRETLSYYRDGSVDGAFYTPWLGVWGNYNEPFLLPVADTVPRLDEMTKGALNVLGQYDNGFFLMVEGGAVDWANHFTIWYDSWAVMIEEMNEFNKAVEAAVAWVENNSSWDETLLIVVPDHDTGYVWGPGSRQDPELGPVFNPVGNNGIGVRPDARWYTWWHSNMLVPLYAKGAGAELFYGKVVGNDPVYGSYIDNTDIFKVMYHGFLKYAVADLIDQVEAMGAKNKGILTSLLSILRAADNSLDRWQYTTSANQLNAFINQVNAQTGKNLPANDLPIVAQGIIDALRK